MTYVIAGIVAVLVCFVLWFIASRWLAASILWTESRYPHLAGSRGLRVGEIIACGLLVLACLALAFWVARLLIGLVISRLPVCYCDYEEVKARFFSRWLYIKSRPSHGIGRCGCALVIPS